MDLTPLDNCTSSIFGLDDHTFLYQCHRHSWKQIEKQMAGLTKKSGRNT